MDKILARKISKDAKQMSDRQEQSKKSKIGTSQASQARKSGATGKRGSKFQHLKGQSDSMQQSGRGQEASRQNVGRGNGSSGQGTSFQCFRCGSPDHRVKDCQEECKKAKCYNCGEIGHKAGQCTKPCTLAASLVGSVPVGLGAPMSGSVGQDGSVGGSTAPGWVFAITRQSAESSSEMVTEKMERQAPIAEPNIDPYALAQMHQIALQRMQQNGGMHNFSGRLNSFAVGHEQENFPTKVEGQWLWDENASRVPHPVSSQLYSEGQGGNPAPSPYGGQMADPKADTDKQTNKEPRPPAHEQDMEIGYEDKPSMPSFEGLEQRFIDEITRLAKEHCDAEDAENTRHRERMIEINVQYQEKLSSVRAQQAKRREEFLLKEAQARLHQYKQAASNHYPTNASPVDPRSYGPRNVSPIDSRGYGPMNSSSIDPRGPPDPHGYGPTNAGLIDPCIPVDPHGYGPTNAGPIDPRGYGGAAPTEAHRAYATGQFESSRERTPFVGDGRNQVPERRVPIPGGRVYNNMSARNH